MSIGTFTLPIDYKSAHDDLYMVVESNNATATDFKYVIDVFANQKQLIRAKIYPDPNTSLGYFNLSNVVSNEMKFDWFEPNGQVFMKELNDSGQIYLPIEVRVGEDVSGLTTLNMDSGIFTVANTIPNLYKRQRTILDYSEKKFLTNRDKLNLQSNYDEDLYVGASMMPNSSFIEVYQYNSAGTQLDSDNIAIPSATMLEIYQLNISPDALVESGITFASGCTYYEVQMWNRLLNPDVFLDKVRVYFKCVTKYEPINLHFMNVYGVFDTARFDCVNKLNMNKQTKAFEKLDVRFGTGVTHYEDYSTDKFTNYQYNETKVNYGSEYNWTYKLTMDFPNDAEYEWLNELIMSPQIWAEIIVDNGQKDYYPVTINTTNYEYSKHVFNRLKAFEVEIDLNQKRNGFRR